jgi:hypothetical protein
MLPPIWAQQKLGDLFRPRQLVLERAGITPVSLSAGPCSYMIPSLLSQSPTKMALSLQISSYLLLDKMDSEISSHNFFPTNTHFPASLLHPMAHPFPWLKAEKPAFHQIFYSSALPFPSATIHSQDLNPSPPLSLHSIPSTHRHQNISSNISFSSGSRTSGGSSLMMTQY